MKKNIKVLLILLIVLILLIGTALGALNYKPKTRLNNTIELKNLYTEIKELDCVTRIKMHFEYGFIRGKINLSRDITDKEKEELVSIFKKKVTPEFSKEICPGSYDKSSATTFTEITYDLDINVPKNIFFSNHQYSLVGRDSRNDDKEHMVNGIAKPFKEYIWKILKVEE